MRIGFLQARDGVRQLIAKDEDEIAAALFHRRKTSRCRQPFQSGTDIRVFSCKTPKDVGDRCRSCILSAHKIAMCMDATRRTRREDAEPTLLGKGQCRSETEKDVCDANQQACAHGQSAIIGTINLRLR